tara:strand:- start:1118 stop:1741 length:624 start_codon:yes stop_codon:yes gene_type:complete
MKIEKFTIEGKKETIEIEDKIFSSKINLKNSSNVLYKLNSNYKGRKAKTKQKNEIKGSTSKIYSQKGTGNARHASRKAPIFVGGGIAHGPKGQNNYRVKKMNKSEKKLSIKSLLSQKNKNKNLIIIDDFKKEIKKTKEMFGILKNFDALDCLIIIDNESKNLISKSTKNLPNVKLTDTNHFSSFDLMKYNKLILTTSSLKLIEKRYA